MTVLDSSPAPTACPENGDGGFGIPTANGRRVLIVSRHLLAMLNDEESGMWTNEQ